MKRTPILPEYKLFPEEFHTLLRLSKVFDSSCSPEAKVYFLDYKDGFYLKSAPASTLQEEARMTAWFHSRKLSAEVLSYMSNEQDWLLTRKIPGEDCTHAQYLSDPERLCDTIAQLLRQLHDADPGRCPVTDQNLRRFQAARDGYARNFWEPELFEPVWAFPSREDAWKAAEEVAGHLRSDVVLHGDYCLPNILLRDWTFSGFIDVGSGGLGDRHFDLLWGSWTLMFNLKTNRYFDRFLDAYGRDRVDPDILRGVAAIEITG